MDKDGAARALVSLAAMQLESAKSAESTETFLKAAGVAAGILEYLGTGLYGFEFPEDFPSGIIPQELSFSTYWMATKNEGFAMGYDFAGKFEQTGPGLMWVGVEDALGKEIADRARVSMLDLNSKGAFVNATPVDLEIEDVDAIQSMSFWDKASGGTLLDRTPVTIDLMHQESVLIRHEEGHLMLGAGTILVRIS